MSHRELRILGDSLDGMSKKSAANRVNRILSQYTSGIFRDSYWAPVRAIWNALEQEGIPYVLMRADYQHDDKGNPNSKQWKFEIQFENDKGRPTTLYGVITASGAGPSNDPLESYDLTAYVS